MNILPAFLTGRQPAPKPPQQPVQVDYEVANSIIELIYAGQDLTKHLTFPTDVGRECICGAQLDAYNETPQHHRLCPVQRFKAAVEVARKAAL